MPKIHINLDERSYDVICEYGALGNTGKLVANLDLGNNAAIITDSNVGPLYAHLVASQLEASGISSTIHTVPAGEASKSLVFVETLCSEITQANHNRKSFVVALGGGVIGDIAGFVASIFYRGIPFIQIPTTIVSLVDSSVGGKTGVNLPEGKNLVGSFHQPKLVIADPATLTSLPSREYREGFAEAIKHAAIRDINMLGEIEALDPYQQTPPADLIAQNIAIKARIVEEDEQELSGTRALLNFGHTIGHGIEASVPYGELLHGEAISLGIHAALYLSQKIHNLPKEHSSRLTAALAQFDLPLKLPSHIKTETIIEKLTRDKKFSSGKLNFVLLNSLGNASIYSDFEFNDIIEAIELIR